MIVSSIKGRIRFLDENIKREEKADKIINRLKNLEGIESIRVNRVIGSLLINYDEASISHIHLLEILKEDIDIRQEEKTSPSEEDGYLNKTMDVLKKNLNRKKYSWGGSSQSSGFRTDKTVTSPNKALKILIYSLLGVGGYKKGKGLMKGQGSGKKS